MNREVIVLILIVFSIVSLASAIFLGVVFVSLISKYQWAWYLPNLHAFIFAVLSIITGSAAFLLYNK